MNTKIKSQEEIIKLARILKKQGKKVVTCNGSFDILHFGHVKSLEEAKQQGDILFVLLNSDCSVRSYKGPNHPINSEKERAGILSAVKYVDHIVIFNEINPKNILKKIKPDIHCNGSDWGKNCVERAVVEECGGKVHVLSWHKGFSTSGLVQKATGVGSKKEVRAVFLDRDGTININNSEYTHKINYFKFFPGVIPALKKLSKTDYKIIIATNQSGIGRGYFKESDLKRLHNWMLKELKSNGVRVDKIYHCPHGPDDNCLCRKPGIGMFLKAVGDFNINLSKSWFVGDRESDVIAGREANIKTLKIGGAMPEEMKIEPHRYTKDLKEAIKIILS